MKKEQPKTFGEFFKESRMKRGLTLRKFCQESGLDAGNVSKLERGILPAPKDSQKLETLATILGLKKNSAEMKLFRDLAALSNQTLIQETITNEALLRRLPVLFRTLNNKDLNDEQLDNLLELIKNA